MIIHSSLLAHELHIELLSPFSVQFEAINLKLTRLFCMNNLVYYYINTSLLPHSA